MADPAVPIELLALVSLTMPVHFRIGSSGFVESVLFGLPDIQAYWAPTVVNDENDEDDGSRDESFEEVESPLESGIDSDVTMDSDLEDKEIDDDVINVYQEEIVDEGNIDSNDNDIVFLQEVITVDW